MPISCTPSDLVAAAKCFQCVPSGMEQSVQMYLLATIAGLGTDQAAIQQIVANAKCFNCVPPEMAEPVLLYLTCQAANA